ncbi:MAG: tripartite tricarboxylate transporter permease [Xanthobacteraceae bacterium]
MYYAAAMVAGLQALFSPSAIVLLVAGMLAGTFVGVIPGLGGAVLLTMLLPFLYGLSVVQGLALMVGAHASIYFAGSITAILLNTPGAPESAPTTIDGYAMTRQGKAARALGISAAATTLGGWIGFVALIGVIPLMHQLIAILKPPELLLLAILAVVLVSQLHAGSLTKGLLSGTFGFMMAFVGYDPITGVQRFSFNLLALYNGFSIVVVALGLFAFSEMFHLYGVKRAVAEGGSMLLSQQPGARVIDGVRDVFSHLWLVVRSAAIGVVVGVVPGVGGVAGNFISYGQAVRTSRHPERFGSGTPEGVIAPEASSLSKEAGSYIPTLALGIPSTVGTAVMLGAFQILGVAPGPTMLTTNLPLVFTIAWTLAITSLLASLIGLVLAPWLARITLLPGPIIVPFVFALAMLGAYAATADMIEVAAVIAFGVVGLLMRRLGYSLPSAIIGFILGGVVQNDLYLTERLGGLRFVTQPLADVLLLLIVLVLVAPFLQRQLQRRRAMQSRDTTAATPTVVADKIIVPARLSTLDLVVDVAWVVFAAAYVIVAWGYPPAAGLVPLSFGIVALGVAVLQLAGHFILPLRRITHAQRRTASAMLGGSEGAGESGDSEAGRARAAQRHRREMTAIAWAVALLVAIYLFGYAVALPAFMLAYFTFGYRTHWTVAVVSAAAMWVLTYPVIEQALGVHLSGGLLFGA